MRCFRLIAGYNAMNTMTKCRRFIVIFLVFVHILFFAACNSKKEMSIKDVADLDTALKSGLPVLADFGRGFCIPCRKMKPILEELMREYNGKVILLILDLKDHMGEAENQKIRVIPTQIFFDKNKVEVYRHEGFMPKEDIVKKFAEMGVK